MVDFAYGSSLLYSPVAQSVERMAVHEMRSTERKGVVHKGHGPRQIPRAKEKRWQLAKKVDRRKYSDRRQYLIRAVHARRKKIWRMSVEYKGGRCEICGYDRCIEALDFHHRELHA